MVVFFLHLQGFIMDPRSDECRMSSINSMLMLFLLGKSGLPSILCEISLSWTSRSNPEILGFGRWVCAFPTGSLPAYIRWFVKCGGKLLFQWGPQTPWSSTPLFWGFATQNQEGGFKDLGHLVVITYHLTLPETGQKHCRCSVSVTFHRQKRNSVYPVAHNHGSGKLPYNWKIILERSIFHFHDCARKSIWMNEVGYVLRFQFPYLVRLEPNSSGSLHPPDLEEWSRGGGQTAVERCQT